MIPLGCQHASRVINHCAGLCLQPLDKASNRLLGCVNQVMLFPLSPAGGEKVGFSGEHDFSMTFPTSLVCFTMKNSRTSPETSLLHIGSPTPDLQWSDPQSDSAGMGTLSLGPAQEPLGSCFLRTWS